MSVTTLLPLITPSAPPYITYRYHALTPIGLWSCLPQHPGTWDLALGPASFLPAPQVPKPATLEPTSSVTTFAISKLLDICSTTPYCIATMFTEYYGVVFIYPMSSGFQSLLKLLHEAIYPPVAAQRCATRRHHTRG